MRKSTLLGVLVGVATAACSPRYASGADDDAPLPLRRDAGTVDAAIGAGTEPISPGTCLWSKSFGGQDDQFGSAVAVDAAGNIAVASSLRGTIDVGGGPLTSAAGSDVALARLDATGRHLHSARWGGAGDQFVTGLVANAAGDLFLMGIFKGTLDFGAAGTLVASDGEFDGYVAHIASDHRLVRADAVSGAGAQLLYGAAADPSNGAFVAGQNSGGTLSADGTTVTRGASSSEAFALRLQSSSQSWGRRIAGSAAGEAWGAVVDSSGSIVVAGAFTGSVTIAGTTRTSAGGLDALVTRISAAGVPLGSFAFGGGNDERALAIAADATGIAVVGEFAGTMRVGATTLQSAGAKDAFLVRLDANLEPVSAVRFGGAADESARVVAFGANGSVVLGGNSAGSADFGGGLLVAGTGLDAFLVGVDGGNVHRWSRRFGGAGEQTLYGSGLAKTPDGDLVLYGGFQNTIDLGCGPLASVDGYDTWLARIRP
jgi:hypothetical protein